MRRPLFALLVLAGSPALADADLKLALSDLTVVGLSSQKSSVFTEHLALRLQANGVRVTTQKDMAALLGLERQKQLFGCGEQSCMAELASALGVDAIAQGEIAKLGDVYQVNLKVISAANGQVVAGHQGTARDEAGVLDVLDTGAAILAGDAAAALGKTATVRKSGGGGPGRKLAVIPVVVGAVGVGAGAGLLVAANGKRGEIPTSGSTQHVSLMQAQQSASVGSTLQTAGWVCVGAGLAALAAGAAWFLLAPSGSSVSASLGATPQGGALVLSGQF